MECQERYLAQQKYEEQLNKIGHIYSQEDVNKIVKQKVKEKEKELKDRYDKVVFDLTDSLHYSNKLLDYADKQLNNMLNRIESKDKTIKELSTLLIRLLNDTDQ